MTLIYGIHTQVGVYLAADLRLTLTDASGQKTSKDDFCKYMSIGKNMHLVAAGNANFASYLIRKIHSSELVNLPYIEFRDKIEKFLNHEAGFYPRIQENGKVARPVAFIFAGADLTKKMPLQVIVWVN
ncbi:MAG: hypothetical protein PHZ00_06130 [Candidatus Peribacteraceae bacterium]|nr:hypothetical protein [Candidatus Peribacteraceae bacterium]